MLAAYMELLTNFYFTAQSVSRLHITIQDMYITSFDYYT